MNIYGFWFFGSYRFDGHLVCLNNFCKYALSSICVLFQMK